MASDWQLTQKGQGHGVQDDLDKVPPFSKL